MKGVLEGGEQRLCVWTGRTMPSRAVLLGVPTVDVTPHPLRDAKAGRTGTTYPGSCRDSELGSGSSGNGDSIAHDPGDRP